MHGSHCALCAADPLAASGVKKRKRLVEPVDPGVTFSDFGGNEALLCDICMLLAHLKHPEMYRYKNCSVSVLLGSEITAFDLMDAVPDPPNFHPRHGNLFKKCMK